MCENSKVQHGSHNNARDLRVVVQVVHNPSDGVRVNHSQGTFLRVVVAAAKLRLPSRVPTPNVH